MVLLSLYAEVLGKFSNSSRFLINVPLFGRPLDEENIDFVVGDFTNILLLPIDISGKNQFILIKLLLSRPMVSTHIALWLNMWQQSMTY